MSRAKCTQCGLVNSIADEACRRCGVDLYAAAQPAAKSKPKAEISIPFGKIAIAAAVVFGIYYWTSTPTAPQAPPNNGAKPQPTLSARQEHENQQKTAYSIAVKNSGGLAESQKRTAETEKLMANTQK